MSRFFDKDAFENPLCVHKRNGGGCPPISSRRVLVMANTTKPNQRSDIGLVFSLTTRLDKKKKEEKKKERDGFGRRKDHESMVLR